MAGDGSVDLALASSEGLSKEVVAEASQDDQPRPGSPSGEAGSATSTAEDIKSTVEASNAENLQSAVEANEGVHADDHDEDHDGDNDGDNDEDHDGDHDEDHDETQNVAVGGSGSEQPLPSDEVPEDLRLAVVEALKGCDLSSLTMGSFRAKLEQDMKVAEGSLEAKKDIVSQLVKEHIDGEVATPQKRSKKRRKLSDVHGVPKDKRRRALKPTAQDLPLEALPVSIAGTQVALTLREAVSGSSTRSYLACQQVPVEHSGKKYAVQCFVQCVAVEVQDGLN